MKSDNIDTESELTRVESERNGFLPFTKPIKLFVFKNEHAVQLSFRLSDSMVYTDKISIAHMDIICQEWNNGGVNGLETWMGKLWWELRDCGPRPERKPAYFVAVTFGKYNFRLKVTEMEDLVEEYKRQLNSKNHWD